MHYHAERGNENYRDFSYVFGLFKTVHDDGHSDLITSTLQP